MTVGEQKVFHFQHGKQSFPLTIFSGTDGADIAEAIRARLGLAVGTPLVAKLGKTEVPLTFSLPDGAKLSLVAVKPKGGKLAVREANSRQHEASDAAEASEAIEDTDVADEDADVPDLSSGPEGAAVRAWERERRRLEGLLRQGAARECDRLQRLRETKQRQVTKVEAEYKRATGVSRAALKAQSDAETRLSELQRRAARAETKMEDLRRNLSAKESEAEQFEETLRQATEEVKVVSAKLDSSPPIGVGPSPQPETPEAARKALAADHPRAKGSPATSGRSAPALAASSTKGTGFASGKARSKLAHEGARGEEVENGAEVGAGIPASKRSARSDKAAPAPTVTDPGHSVVDRAAVPGPATWNGRQRSSPVTEKQDRSAGRAADAQAAAPARSRPVQVDQHEEDEVSGMEVSNDEEERWTESSVASNHEFGEPPPPSYATSVADEDIEDEDMEESASSSGEKEDSHLSEEESHLSQEESRLSEEESHLSEEESLADARLEEEYDDNEGSVGPLETDDSDNEMPALQK